MEALFLTEDAAPLPDWEALCRACERARLRLRRGRWRRAALADQDLARTDAVILCLGPDSAHPNAIGAPLTALAQRLPVLVVSASESPPLAEELLGLGVQDLLPPQALSGSLLASLVRNAVERFRNASALRLSNELLAVLAGEPALERRLEAVTSVLLQRCSASAAGIRLLAPDGRLPFSASQGFEEAFLSLALEHRLPKDGGACAGVALGRHPGGLFSLGTSDLEEGPRISQSIEVLPCRGRLGGQLQACAQAPGDLAAVFPIRRGAEILGLLQLRFPSAQVPSGPLLRTLEAIGLQLGTQVDHARSLGTRDLRERRYRALVSAISSAVFSLDARGDMLEPQPEWLAFTGEDGPPAGPRAWLERVHEDDRSRLERIFRENATPEGLREEELRIFHARDAKHHSCLLRMVPRQGDDGRLLEWIVALTDLQTARDATQERATLEAQLRQAQRLEAVGRLAGGVAHDFNNLLTIIQGNLYLLKTESGASAALAGGLLEIEQATGRASDLTRHLLAFGRRQVVRPEPLDLSRIVRGLEKMLRRVIGEDILLRILTKQGLALVLADPGHMEQLLLNLALRARDVMPRGGTLTIETTDTETDGAWISPALLGAPGPHVLLSVSDSGPSLDEDTRSRIFEPYLTANPKSTQKSLGMAVVYGIVKQHGGHILVSGPDEVGTTFRIAIPVSPEVPRAADAPSASPGGPVEPGKQKTVLVVEDETPVRNLVARILKHYGYAVLLASGGAEALERSRAHPGEIHLVLSDVVMPERYGPEVVAALRKQRPRLPVLYMSGYADSVVLTEGMLARETAFLEKPFTPEELADHVRRVIEGSSLSR